MSSSSLQLPMNTASLLPHAGRMRCVDRLVAHAVTKGVAETVLCPGHMLLRDGVLDPAGYVELAAQAAGAVRGYTERLQGREPDMGYLVGVQEFRIHEEARQGDALRMEIDTVAELGNVSVLSAVISCEGRVLAEGTLKVFTAA